MKSKAKTRKWVIGATVLFSVPMLLFVSYARETLSREKAPCAMAKAALQLSFGARKFVLIDSNPRQVLMRSDSHQPLDLYMTSCGWHRVEPIQMGALHYFGKGKTKMRIDSRPFTGRYRFCTLPENP